MQDNLLVCVMVIIVIILLIYYISYIPYTRNENQHEPFAWSNPNIISNPIYSYYINYDKNVSHRPGSWAGEKTMLIEYHYIDNNAECNLMRPIWEKIKKNLSKMDIIFVENNEDMKPSSLKKVITHYPTIIKYQNGVGDIYNGFISYEPFKIWILKAT